MREDGKLDYLELPAADLAQTKAFYGQAFGWTFVDYGPTYAAFDQGLDGGFDADQAERTQTPLPVLYAKDLEAMLARVEAAGGRIVKPIYAFPGGRRFHPTPMRISCGGTIATNAMHTRACGNHFQCWAMKPAATKAMATTMAPHTAPAVRFIRLLVPRRRARTGSQAMEWTVW